MNVRRGGLGRGLGALIPTAPVDGEQIDGARFDELPVSSIEPNPRQPREVFDEEALAELVTSIREVGVLQPVVVREVGPGRYQLIMGERRWRATQAAGLELIPAIIRDTADDAMLRDALLENLHRQQLNALEEAAAYQQLLEEFGATHEELADRIGRSRSHVSNTLRLLQLSPAVQRRVAAGVLSAGHARALLTLDSPDAQEQLAARIVAEGLSVRATEEIVALSGEEPTPRAPRTRRPTAPAVTALADLLSEHLETRVTIDLGQRRGKVVVQFATLDDLQRIVGLIAPDAAGLLRDDDAGAPEERLEPHHEEPHHEEPHHGGEPHHEEPHHGEQHDGEHHEGEQHEEHHHEGEQHEEHHHDGEQHEEHHHDGEQHGEHHHDGEQHGEQHHDGEQHHHDGGHHHDHW